VKEVFYLYGATSAPSNSGSSQELASGKFSRSGRGGPRSIARLRQDQKLSRGSPGRQIAVKLIVPGDDTPILIEQARVQWIVDRFVDVQQQEVDELEQLIDECIALDEGREA
jgi:hypothetical protein